MKPEQLSNLLTVGQVAGAKEIPDHLVTFGRAIARASQDASIQQEVSDYLSTNICWPGMSSCLRGLMGASTSNKQAVKASELYGYTWYALLWLYTIKTETGGNFCELSVYAGRWGKVSSYKKDVSYINGLPATTDARSDSKAQAAYKRLYSRGIGLYGHTVDVVRGYTKAQYLQAINDVDAMISILSAAEEAFKSWLPTISIDASDEAILSDPIARKWFNYLPYAHLPKNQARATEYALNNPLYSVWDNESKTAVSSPLAMWNHEYTANVTNSSKKKSVLMPFESSSDHSKFVLAYLENYQPSLIDVCNRGNLYSLMGMAQEGALLSTDIKDSAGLMLLPGGNQMTSLERKVSMRELLEGEDLADIHLRDEMAQRHLDKKRSLAELTELASQVQISIPELLYLLPEDRAERQKAQWVKRLKER